MNWLDEMEHDMSSEADRSTLNYRLDVMEQRIANLEQWLNEVANDMLNRTSTEVVVGNSNGQVTLRVPAELVTILEEAAQRKALPYHGLARSFIADGVRERRIPLGCRGSGGPRRARRNTAQSQVDARALG